MPARKKSSDGTPAQGKTTRAKGGRKKTGEAPVQKATARQPAARPAAGGTGKSLVIVESPKKARTIQKYLGPAYEVTASYGHVRDLPKRKMGIDIENGWDATYVVLDDKQHKGVVPNLKKAAARASMVYLATDPDREGEAIAWHLKNALELDDSKAQRVTFHEITKRAIQEAFEHSGDIDMDLVHAYFARRFLDRVVGYKLSPLLGKKIGKGLSAGRVQSVAVRLIVEREKEIAAFKSEEYWRVTAHLSPEDLTAGNKVDLRILKKEDRKAEEQPEDEEAAEGQPAATALKAQPGKTLVAELAEWDGRKFQAASEEQAAAVGNALAPAAYVVSKIEQKDKQDRPAPPFTTSTLQQQASTRLRKSAKQTMQIAQQLYEGVELGREGLVGLITYMRTDSTRVSGEAVQACRDLIQSQYGDAYLPETPNFYKSGKAAQDAHEAIRPTDVSYTPERVAPYLKPEQKAVYELIWRRFVASQMKPAIFAVTNVEITAGKGLFKAQGRILKFDGYRKVLSYRGKQEDAELPHLDEDQKLFLLDLLASQHFTQPPPRFNDASLIRTLEKEGIGRPSTYASIIDTIQKRRYVDLIDRRFHATPLGIVVTDQLIAHFPDVMNFKFTAQMEDNLDQIEENKTQWQEVLDNWYGPFSQALDLAQDQMETIRAQDTGEPCPKCGRPMVKRYSPNVRSTEMVGCSGYPDCKYIKPTDGDNSGPTPTDYDCPTCGKKMDRYEGRKGPYLQCSDHPDCRTRMNFDAQGNPVLAARPTGHKCDKCGKDMVLRQGPRGMFLGCTGFPKCRNAKEVDEHGNPIQPADLGLKCEKCGSPMQAKRSRFGNAFLGCSGYPKCRNTMKVPEELKEKVEKLLPAKAAKKEPLKIKVEETCPDCGAAMEVRSARGNRYFLGCTQFSKTKCKGTREVPPEMLDEIERQQKQQESPVEAG